MPMWCFEDREFFLRLARAEPMAYLDAPVAVVRPSPDSLHLVAAEFGRRTMLARLAEEGRHSMDAELRAAARHGVLRLGKRLAWYDVSAGRPAAAVLTDLRAFRETRAPSLLARAALDGLPKPCRSWVRDRLGRARVLAHLIAAWLALPFSRPA